MPENDIKAMPIHRSVETTRISQEDFKPLAYEVMEHVYAKALHWANVTHRQVTFTTIQ